MGVIYILTNPSFEGYVKIGYADNIKARLRQLNSSECTPFAFRIYATYEVPSRLTDKKVHAIIDKLNPNLRSVDNSEGKQRVREFYLMSPEDAYSIFEAMAEIHQCTDKLKLYSPTEDEIEEERLESKTKKHREQFSFSACSIPVGAVLDFYTSYREKTDLIVTVADDKHVMYDGQVFSLSGLAGKIINKKPGRGTSYYKYNGKWLNDIRDELDI